MRRLKNTKLGIRHEYKSHGNLTIMIKPKKDFYTAKELAEMLSLNVMTIYRYIDAGKLKAYKIGKEFRIEKAEFERFLKKTSTK